MTTYQALILDFDGPMCDVFAGYPAANIAKAIRDEFSINEGPDDPLAYLANNTGTQAQQIDRLITKHELQAVEIAVETSGLREVLELPVPIAIASNNSSAAVQSWLKRAGLSERIIHVEGRTVGFLKPHPHSVNTCVEVLSIQPQECLFIGDSQSDAEAALGAGVGFCGYANKPHKTLSLGESGSEVVAGLDEIVNRFTFDTRSAYIGPR